MTQPNKPMHPTADTTAFKFLNLAGRRVIGGVSPLFSRRRELNVLGLNCVNEKGCE